MEASERARLTRDIRSGFYRIQSIRMVLATAAEKGWMIRPLHVWLEIVSGYETKDETTGATLVMKLIKSRDSPEQSPNNWHGTIDIFLVGYGYKALKSDTCVYIFNGTNTMKASVRTTTRRLSSFFVWMTCC